MEGIKNEYKILVRKLIGKQPSGRAHRWID